MTAAKPLELPLRANPPTLVFGWEIMDAKGTLVAMMQRHPGMRAEAREYCEFLVAAANVHADLVDALMRALPFVEDAKADPLYKPAYVQERLKAIHAALEKADAMHHRTPAENPKRELPPILRPQAG